MITSKELYPIGFVSKTHGIKGELNVQLDTQYNPEDFHFLVFDIDSIFIPFEIENSRGKGDANRLVLLKGVTDVQEAKEFCGKTVYILLSELSKHPDYSEEQEGGLYLSDLIGFKVYDETDTNIGEVVGFNDDTQNYLLEILRPNGTKVFIPYVDEWLLNINLETKTITFDLPNGLIE